MADLISRAIGAPGVYVFAELLEVKTVQEVSSSLLLIERLLVRTQSRGRVRLN